MEFCEASTGWRHNHEPNQRGAVTGHPVRCKSGSIDAEFAPHLGGAMAINGYAHAFRNG
jgi:hypothetical protein